MKLNSGILIIGSLLWDNSTIRRNWRRTSLVEKNKIFIKVPILYGRKSESRMDTYTMVFSSSLSDKDYGQGVILKFATPITSIDNLISEVDNIIRVERDKTKDEWKLIRDSNPFLLNWSWGVAGLCINPKHINDNEYSEAVKEVVQLWQNSLSNFSPGNYCLKEERPFTDEKAIFEINWNQDMRDLDFLIATIIKPNVESYPNAETISETMYHGKYYSYFINNHKNNIYTKDDPIILQLIKDKYCISKYIEAEFESK